MATAGNENGVAPGMVLACVASVKVEVVGVGEVEEGGRKL